VELPLEIVDFRPASSLRPRGNRQSPIDIPRSPPAIPTWWDTDLIPKLHQRLVEYIFDELFNDSYDAFHSKTQIQIKFLVR
jgi:hypothetical protein